MKQNDSVKWVQTLWNPLKAKKNSPLESSESGIKVAAYCRVSPGVTEKVKSLENQVNHYTHLISNKPNWKFVGIYFDHGISGVNYKDRQGLTRLLRHCEEGRVDLILTKSISRLSRNSGELLEIINHLKNNNVSIYFEKEKIDTAVEYNQFLLETYAALAQNEVENISQATRWGIEKKLLQGKPKFTKLLGYDVVTVDGEKTLKINEEKETVLTIYNLFLKGYALKEIARYLIKHGFKTSYGNDVWYGSTVKNILTNVIYTGNYLTSDKSKDLFTKKETYGERNRYLIKNTHPAIISMDVFEKAQKRLEEISPRYQSFKKRNKHSLSGRMRCGCCDYSLIVHSRHGYHYWKCYPSILHKCHFQSIREDVIQEMMLKAFMKRFNFNYSGVRKKLIKILEKINQNDHFEFHRLKFFAEITIAEQQLSKSKVEQLRQDYLQFEEKVTKIENDRHYREKAIRYLNEIRSMKVFKADASIELMRAWITELIVYSPDDYLVLWVDGIETEVGDCSQYKMPQRYTSDDTLISPGDGTSIPPGESTLIPPSEGPPTNDTIDDSLKNSDFLISDKKENDEMNKTNEVIKITPSDGSLIMKDIRKNIVKDKMYSSLAKSKKKRVAAYCRVSTDFEEQKISLKTQIAYYTYTMLKNPNYEFAGIYVDEGISGKSLKNRKEFLKLMEECKKGNVDLILTKSISRFSRNTVNCLSQIKMLSNLPKPVHVYFEKENIHTSDEKAHMMIALFTGLAQEEIINTANSISWGRRKYAERGIVQVKKCYGYDVKNGELIINEEEAKVIKRIYRLTLNGKNLSEIAKQLMNDQIKSPSGDTSWNSGKVSIILRKSIYTGDYVYQKYYTKDTIEGKIGINRGELPQVLIENHHDAIIDKKDWEEVQQILDKKRERFKKRVQNPFPKKNSKNKAFTNKLVCGECGNKVSHYRFFENKKEYNNWRCGYASKYTDHKSCQAKCLNQVYLELNFMKLLQDIRESKPFFNKLQEKINMINLRKDELVKRDSIKMQINQLNQELYHTVDEELNKQGQDYKKVDRLTEEIVSLYAELKELSNREELAKRYAEEVKRLKNELNAISSNTKSFRAVLYNRIVEKAVVFKDGKIIYKLKFGMEWSIDYNYRDYKDALLATKRRTRQKKLLNSDEVKKLLVYCKEPKSFQEMLEFMNTMMYISESHLRAAVINPLLEKGKIKKTHPNKPYSRQQKYYSI